MLGVAVLGLLGTSLCVLLLGHLNLLRPGAMWALLVTGSALMAVRRRTVLAALSRAIAAASPRTRFGGIALAVVSVVCAMLVISALRPPFAIDEVEYHWASPLFWALQNGWTDSPYKLSDGFALTEILYTLAAVTGGYVVAHTMHLMFFAVLLLATGTVARLIDVPASVAVAGVASMPVVLNQASVSYNDVAAAAYSVAAIALLLAGPPTRRRLLLVGVVAAAAVSTKTYCVVLGPALSALLLIRTDAGATNRWWRAGGQITLLAGPMLSACGFWLIRARLLTGTFYDGTPVYLASSPEDPLLRTGQAAGRIPTPSDLVELPFVPFMTGVIGQSEPYGGRTGLVLLVLLPLLVVALIAGRQNFRARLWPVLVPAAVWFLLLAPFLIKTRFNITVFVLLTIAAAGAFAWALALMAPRLRGPAQAALVLAITASAIGDSGRIIL